MQSSWVPPLPFLKPPSLSRCCCLKLTWFTPKLLSMLVLQLPTVATYTAKFASPLYSISLPAVTASATALAPPLLCSLPRRTTSSRTRTLPLRTTFLFAHQVRKDRTEKCYTLLVCSLFLPLLHLSLTLLSYLDIHSFTAIQANIQGTFNSAALGTTAAITLQNMNNVTQKNAITSALISAIVTQLPTNGTSPSFVLSVSAIRVA